MLRRNERILDNIPIGALGIIALDGCQEMGKRVNDYLVKWRKEDGHVHKDDVAFSGYERDNYLIDARVPRFGSGEAKGIIKENPVLRLVLGTCATLAVSTAASNAIGMGLASTFVLVLEQAPPVEELAAIPGILKVEHLTPTRFRLHFDGEDHGMTRRVAALAVEKGWRPSEIMLERDSLDTVFAQLSGKGVASLHTGAHTDAAASRS